MLWLLEQSSNSNKEADVYNYDCAKKALENVQNDDQKDNEDIIIEPDDELYTNIDTCLSGNELVIESGGENYEESNGNERVLNQEEILNENDVIEETMNEESATKLNEELTILDEIGNEQRQVVVEKLDGSTAFIGCKKTVNNNSDINEEAAIMETDEYERDVNEKKTSQTETRKRRVLGLPYMGYKRNGKRVINGIPKGERTIKKRCLHKEQQRYSSRSFLCGKFTEDDRVAAFNRFWKMKSWAEKRAFVKGLVTTRNIKRRRKEREDKNNLLRKQEGHDIFLQKGDSQKLRVCRQFFINTLGLGEDTFKRWVKKDGSPNLDNEDRESVANSRTVDKVEMTQNLKDKGEGSRKSVRQNVILWLHQLPKVPSHYCRASSKKIYVESTFRSQLHMFSVYKDWCTANNKKSAGRILFCKILSEESIAIHMPRKDQCDICCAFKVGSVTQELYDRHIKNKNDAREAKNAAKMSANSKKLVLTMDLQSVLLCPLLLASQVYYKQKLQVHNFTLYELNSGNVTLYVWHESNGGVTSNEFTSCIVDFISNLPDNIEEVTLISDGCNYQNRNKVLASSLSDLAKRKQITIEQLYLEKGHTMMEADSVHATLEKYFKPPINSPADYIALMRLARPSNPYTVKVLDYTFFRNYETSANLPSLRPGKKTGDPQVVDIKALIYKTDGSILYKINYTDEYNSLPQRKKGNTVEVTSQLYRSPIPISESKYRHLQEMKSIIEEPHRPFYDSLTFKPDKKKIISF